MQLSSSGGNPCGTHSPEHGLTRFSQWEAPVRGQREEEEESREFVYLSFWILPCKCTMNQLSLLPKSMLLLRWPTLSHSKYCKWPHSLCSLGKKNLGATKPPHPNLLRGLNYNTLNFENSLFLGGKCGGTSSNWPIFSVPFASYGNFSQYTHSYSCNTIRLKHLSLLSTSKQDIKHASMFLPLCSFPCYHQRMNKLFTSILLRQHFFLKHIHTLSHTYHHSVQTPQNKDST